MNIAHRNHVRLRPTAGRFAALCAALCAASLCAASALLFTACTDAETPSDSPEDPGFFADPTLSLVAANASPLPCYEPLESSLQADTVAVWRTRKPLVPLHIKPIFGRPWSSSSALVVNGGTVAVADPVAGAVHFLSRSTLAKQYSVAVGSRPYHLLLAKDGALWVSLRGDGHIARIAPNAKVAARLKVGTEPLGMGMADDGSRLYVALGADHRVAAVHYKGGAITALPQSSFEVNGRPRAVAVAHLGGSPGVERVVVAMQHGPAVVRHIHLNPAAPSFDQRLAPLRGSNPAHLATGDRFELASWRSISAAIHPTTGDVLIPHVIVFTGDDLPGMNAPTATSGYSAAPGPRCSSTPLRPVETTVSAIGHIVRATVADRAVRDPYSRRQLITRFDQPTAIAHHRTASIALVTAGGTDNVLVLNTALPDPMQAPIAEITVGPNPDAIAISDDGSTAFVRDGFATQVTEIDLKPLLATVSTQWLADDEGLAAGPRMAPRFLAAARSVAFADDLSTQRLRDGRRLFFGAKNPKISAASRFACATCHLDGGDDKQVWNIGAGPRQTPILAGRLAGTAPFNWKGTEPELVGNMRQTVERMGGHGLTGKDELALQEFLLKGLPAIANPRHNGALTPAEVRGRTLFFDPEVGCASCHTPPTFTDGKQHQIGTVDNDAGASSVATHCSPGAAFTLIEEDAVFDTPSLLGIRDSGPYLHDGSAATLKDVLDRTAGTMGNTSHLDGNQRADLIAFLRTL